MKFKDLVESSSFQPYVIAELGSNHNGDMNLARKLITQAKEAGADCVKFQSWTKNSIFSRKKYEQNYFIDDDYRNRSDFTLETIVEEYSISENELLEMKNFADDLGIECTSTPFSIKEADFLVDRLDVPFIKVASMDLNNTPYLSYLARKMKPLVISTGMGQLSEIDVAVRTFEANYNYDISILHCVASYPPKDTDVNLKNITTLKNVYPDYKIGFSDHTIGTPVALASVALGARIIEKHFTLDKGMEGWDHKVSADLAEFTDIVEGARRISNAIGAGRIVVSESKDQILEFRRSIVLKKDLPSGHELTANDLDYKRPGTGLSPTDTNFVIGLKLNKDLQFDHILSIDDLR